METARLAGTSARRLPRKLTFTLETLRALKPPTRGRLTWWDTRTPGLCLRVTPTGAASFYLYRWAVGRPVKYRLGAFPGITPDQARKLAAKVSMAMAAGQNPQDQRRAERGELSLADLFKHYMDTHARPKKRTWREDERQRDRYLASLLPRRLSTITRGDVAALHARVGQDHGHYAANRLLSLLRKVLSTAADLGYHEPNPAAGIPRFAEAKRQRYLAGDDLRAFWSALEAERSAVARDAFKLALLTGARRANVLGARWADLDLQKAIWRIPRTKTGRPLDVPLVPAAVELLKARQEKAAGEWIFPGRRGNGPMTEWGPAFRRICKAAGLSGYRAHDLRHSLASWAVSAGASLPVVGRALGHLSSATTARYGHVQLDPVRLAMTAGAAAMLTEAKSEPPPTEKGAANHAGQAKPGRSKK